MQEVKEEDKFLTSPEVCSWADDDFVMFLSNNFRSN